MIRLSYKSVGILQDSEGHLYSPRGETGDTTDLQEQLLEWGSQRTPIRVTKPSADGIHIVTRGHRRKVAIDALRKHFRDYAITLENQPSSEERNQLLKEALDECEHWSHYLVEITDIDPDDIDSVLADMDADLTQREVDPVSLGEAILYRMDHLGWDFNQCVRSLGLSGNKARACLRAADPQATVDSVRAALRSGELSLSQFMKKLAKLDRLTQEKIMGESKRRAESGKSHGTINTKILNSVIEDMVEPVETPDPELNVLPLLAGARENIQLALEIRDKWSPVTEQGALWQLEEILRLIDRVIT